jgi:hypothetical protein
MKLQKLMEGPSPSGLQSRNTKKFTLIITLHPATDED